jgi:hypothetical protein
VAGRAPQRQPLCADLSPLTTNAGNRNPGQLDFVFASTAIADPIEVRALNSPEAWAPMITVEW